MGVTYAVVCDDCKVYRPLDKFHTLCGGPRDRDEALVYAGRIKMDAFRAGLLVGFMGDHRGHNCRVLDDLAPWEPLLEVEQTYEKEDFWK
ncbi:MAG: hypothetical protein AMS22_08385 [Thiotrichales bacterium SG8_50]|nr:MAG: hypothetical protein AMS22_08385 [Thiotrichales bacterium SG8_50]